MSNFDKQDMAETLRNSFQNLQNLVECVICLGVLQSPVITRCQHHFCATCIQEAMAGQNSIPCPLCKRAVTNRSLRPDGAMKKVVAAANEILEAGKKEILGTEVATIDTSKLKPSKTTSTSGSTSTKDKRAGFRSLFQTPKRGKPQNSKKPAAKASVKSGKENGLDLLDIVDGMEKRPMLKTPPFGGSSTSADSKQVPSVSLKEDKNQALNDGKVDDDPFHFPITQTQPTTATKPNKKLTKKMSVAKQKSPKVQLGKRKSTRKSISKIQSSEKSPLDQQLIKSIVATENHILTVEPAEKAKQKSDVNNSGNAAKKPKRKSVTRIALKKIRTKIAKKRNGDDVAEGKDETSKHEKIDKYQEITIENNALSKQKEGSDTTLAKLIKEHPKVTKRLLYSDTSSSVAAAQEIIVNNASEEIKLPDVEDKVSMWLKGLEPSNAVGGEEDVSGNLDSGEAQMGESELEEFVSASQYFEQPQKVIKRKKRKLPPDLLSSEEMSPAQQKVFGAQKPKRQYLNKKKDTELPRIIVEPLHPVEETTLSRKRAKRGNRNTNMFDVTGLSQGVSPFTTPTKHSSVTDAEKEDAQEPIISQQPIESINEDNNAQNSEKQPVGERENEQFEQNLNKASQSLPKTKEITKDARISNEETKLTPDNEEKKTLETKSLQQLTTVQKTANQALVTQESTPQGPTHDAALLNVPVDIHHRENSATMLLENNETVPEPHSPTDQTDLSQSKEGFQKTVVNLGDMPIVCVRETQDNVPPYYVETPCGRNTSEVLHGNAMPDAELHKERPRPTVELGLLDFSEPSQAIDKHNEAGNAPSEKILQTCRMVLMDLDESKSTETNNQGPSQVTVHSPPRVGRVVEVQKVRLEKNVSNTMKDVNLSLSQLADDSIGGEKSDQANIPKYSLQANSQQKEIITARPKSPVFSLYACSSSEGGNATHISDCDTNLIQNTDDIVPAKRPMVRSSRKTPKRKRKSRLTMPAKKPRVKIVDAPKSNKVKASKDSSPPMHTSSTNTLNSNDPVDKVGKEPEALNSSMEQMDAAPDHSNIDMPKKPEGSGGSDASSCNSDTTKVWCTSNGWGGTKLKIRIQHSSKNKTNKKNTCTAERQIPAPPNDVSDGLKSICQEFTEPNVVAEKLGSSSRLTVCFKDAGTVSDATPESSKLTSQDSTLVIADSVRMVSNAPKLLAKPMKKAKEPDVVKQQQSPSKTLMKKKTKTPIKAPNNPVHISSSWPTTSAECSVVLNKINTALFCPITSNRKSWDVSADVDGRLNEDIVMDEDKEDVVIPNSPLLFAPSQPSDEASHHTENADVKIVSEDAAKDILPLTLENQELCTDTDGDKVSVMEKILSENYKRPPNLEDIIQKTSTLSELLRQFTGALNAPHGGVSTKYWANFMSKCRELDNKIDMFSSPSASQASDIKCTAKHPKRKLSMSSEEENDPMESVKPTNIEELHDSDPEIDSSLPTILPIVRNNHLDGDLNLNQDSESHLQPFCKRPQNVQNAVVITSTAVPQIGTDEVEMLNFDDGNSTIINKETRNQQHDIVSAFGDISKVEKQRIAGHTEVQMQQTDDVIIHESPQSPDIHETSEYEDASDEQNNMEQEDGQYFTAGQSLKSDNFQQDITASQVPSPTPPPPPVLSHSADLTNVTDLLRKISEFTGDLNKEHDNNEEEKMETPPEAVSENVAEPLLLEPPATHNVVEKPTPTTPHHKANQPINTRGTMLETRSPRPQTPDGRSILSPLNSSSISVSTNDTSLHSIAGRRIGIMASGMRGKAAEITKKFAKRCRGTFYDTFVSGEVTHVIVKTDQLRCDRTLKFIQGIASKIWVVSYLWIVNSLKQKKMLPEEGFEVIGDNLDTDDQLSMHAPKRSRTSSVHFKLLSGFAVCCVPPFALFTADQLREVLDLCGATVVKNAEDFKDADPKLKKIITLDANAYTDSLPNYTDLAQVHKAEAVSCDWVLECIATFRVHPTNLFPVEDFESQVDVE